MSGCCCSCFRLVGLDETEALWSNNFDSSPLDVFLPFFCCLNVFVGNKKEKKKKGVVV